VRNADDVAQDTRLHGAFSQLSVAPGAGHRSPLQVPGCLTTFMLECNIEFASTFYQSAAIFVPIGLVDLSHGQLL
jgi:hypothetical protein